YVWRIRKTGMVHALELYRDLGRRDKQVSIPDGATWEVEEKDNPWKKSSFPDRAEIERILAEGIQNNQLKGFVSVVYSEELIPAAKALGISLEQYPQISEPKLTLRGERAFYLWAENSPTEFRFKATTGKMGDTGVKAEIRLMTQIDGESVIVDEFFLPN